MYRSVTLRDPDETRYMLGDLVFSRYIIQEICLDGVSGIVRVFGADTTGESIPLWDIPLTSVLLLSFIRPGE